MPRAVALLRCCAALPLIDSFRYDAMTLDLKDLVRGIAHRAETLWVVPPHGRPSASAAVWEHRLPLFQHEGRIGDPLGEWGAAEPLFCPE